MLCLTKDLSRCMLGLARGVDVLICMGGCVVLYSDRFFLGPLIM